MNTKLLNAIVCSLYFGRDLPYKLRATAPQLKALVEALRVTRDFEQVLESPTVSPKLISEALVSKGHAALQFSRHFGTRWPL